MRLHPRAEATVRSRIGAVSGVTVLAVKVHQTMAVGATRSVSSVVITARGWSPSLNRVVMTWTAEIDAPGTRPDVQAAGILSHLAEHLAIQESRLEEGLALGTAAPFGVVEDGEQHDTRNEVGHVLVDRALATMWRRLRDCDAGREASDSIYDIHHADRGPRYGLETAYHGPQTHLSDEPWQGEIALEGRRLFRDLRLGDSSFFDGRRLMVGGELPDTIVAGSVGRRLGDVVQDVPAEIADRIVVSAGRARMGASDDRGPAITFGTEPDMATVAEIDGDASHG